MVKMKSCLYGPILLPDVPMSPCPLRRQPAGAQSLARGILFFLSISNHLTTFEDSLQPTANGEYVFVSYRKGWRVTAEAEDWLSKLPVDHTWTSQTFPCHWRSTMHL